ncbi:MAG TPA: phosphoribosylaminoimidazolesuccinocarboxamide synthase [Chthonomonadales bacterium]|nr:phosphoribosylaminoimidazolesuccinocarboxamide synthase [Chthonomonadales bacterium]
MRPVLKTDIPGLTRFATGKVRDVYDLNDSLLIVTTDRISAFDVIMADCIPEKGRVLTELSRFWFRLLRPLVSTHYITTDQSFILQRIACAGGSVSEETCEALTRRSMLVVKAEAFPVECVVRGYLAGSLWKEYVAAGGREREVTLHGITLPGGLVECQQLPVPIFTPATKASSGHDENISVKQMEEIIGKQAADAAAGLSVQIYLAASSHARSRGLILADTKFEFGMHGGALTLIDEVLTPDSSRFWDAGTYSPGSSQPSYDKQFLRDWLEASGWNKEPPPPPLPEDIVRGTSERYQTALRRIVG